MKLNVSGITTLFKPEELRALELACSADKTILPALDKILRSKLEKQTIPTKESDFDSPSWGHQRAYRDGRMTELVALLDLIKE